jgi:hypothetical protein
MFIHCPRHQMQSGRKIKCEKNYMRILVLSIYSKLLGRLNAKPPVMNVYELRELSSYQLPIERHKERFPSGIYTRSDPSYFM